MTGLARVVKKIIPDKPPAARAPSVLDQRPALERELVDLKQQIAERALAAYEGTDGRAKLAALDTAIRGLSFQIECNTLAHELALRLDREAVAAWRDQVQADPKTAVEGITKDKCCRRCDAAHGCIITGGACIHPVMVGNGSLPNQYQGNPGVRAVHRAAAEKLRVFR